jgi:hypothetical protein
MQPSVGGEYKYRTVAVPLRYTYFTATLFIKLNWKRKDERKQQPQDRFKARIK